MLNPRRISVKHLIIVLIVVIIVISIMTYSQILVETYKEKPKAITAKKEYEKFKLISEAFDEGEKIPIKYTCDGEDISPPLSWEGFPENTKSFVLIMEDPDAPGGTFTHWIMFNIPKNVTSLKEGIQNIKKIEGIGIQCKNDFGKFGYGGPCPPPGTTHRYVFKLYAIDTMLNLGPEASKHEVLNAIEGHVLAIAELIGIYGR